MACSKTSEYTLKDVSPLLLQQRLLAELEKVAAHKGVDV
jgi:hypothetical protein